MRYTAVSQSPVLPRDVLRRLWLLLHPTAVSRWHRDLVVRRHAATSRPERPDRPRTIQPIRTHQGIANTRPLRRLPVPLADPQQTARLDIRKRQRLGVILHTCEHAA